MSTTNRLARVSRELQREISQIVLFELRNSKLGFITITRVTVSPDLQYAKVYLTVLGDEEQLKQSLAILTQASGYVHHLLIKRMKMRYIPFLSFHYDDTVEKEIHMTKLFHEIEEDIKESETAESSEAETVIEEAVPVEKPEPVKPKALPVPKKRTATLKKPVRKAKLLVAVRRKPLPATYPGPQSGRGKKAKPLKKAAVRKPSVKKTIVKKKRLKA